MAAPNRDSAVGDDAGDTPIPYTIAGATVTLRDGTQVALQPMQPNDADRLVQFHATLSSDTTYLRFFGAHPQLRAAELYRFTHVDHADREAVIAVVDDAIVAVARFDRVDDGHDAEVAFVVSDAWQGRGLGTLMFQHLAQVARAHGITRFVAETLSRNVRMLSVFRHAGLPMTVRHDGTTVHVIIDLE